MFLDRADPNFRTKNIRTKNKRLDYITLICSENGRYFIFFLWITTRSYKFMRLASCTADIHIRKLVLGMNNTKLENSVNYRI